MDHAELHGEGPCGSNDRGRLDPRRTSSRMPFEVTLKDEVTVQDGPTPNFMEKALVESRQLHGEGPCGSNDRGTK